MEDENGLELSLGLGCGGSSAKPKGKICSSSDNKTEDSDRGSKVVDHLKNFLHSCTEKQNSGTGSQNSAKPQGNFFNDLSKANTDEDASANLKNNRLWVSSGKRSIDIEEEKRPEVGSKRKISSDEINSQKKHQRDAHHNDLHDKKTSHISVTTEDDSIAENEDVADSEVEGSTSMLVSLHGSKPFIGVGGPDVPKEVHGYSNSSAVDLQGQKKLPVSPETELKHGNLKYGVPFPVQPVVSYSFPGKEFNSLGASSNSGYQIKGMVPVMPTSNCEQQKGDQSVNSANLPVMFGYSPAQLPTLDKDNAWGLVSHLQHFHPSLSGRSPPNSDKHNDELKIPQGHLSSLL
uniref:Uncharacterized protein MANES_03G024900 n=1 Tax=Rhizophora mucronata TaxID=61149 RepID=A0A2P2K339_RHIMU